MNTYREQANFPNLRRLFIEARTDNEERDVSRKAVSIRLAVPERVSKDETQIPD